jgi:hypothetical protein
MFLHDSGISPPGYMVSHSNLHIHCCDTVRSHIININVSAVCVCSHGQNTLLLCQTNDFKDEMSLMFQPACGEDVTNDKVKNLKNKLRCDHAVVFHGVLGHEKREGRSPR